MEVFKNIIVAILKKTKITLVKNGLVPLYHDKATLYSHSERRTCTLKFYSCQKMSLAFIILQKQINLFLTTIYTFSHVFFSIAVYKRYIHAEFFKLQGDKEQGMNLK